MRNAPPGNGPSADAVHEPLELLERPAPATPRRVPAPALAVQRPPEPADPFMQRFTTILVAGLVLVGFAVLARTLLDAAAPVPAGIVERRAAAPGEAATIARYEWERDRIAR